MKFLFKILLIALLPLCLTAKNDDYQEVAEQIKVALEKVITEYKAGNVEQAVADTQNAYFGLFEDIEAAIRINLGRKKAFAMEKQFGEIRKAIKAGESAEQILARIDNINKEIEEVLPEILTGHRLVGEYSDAPAAASSLDTSNFIAEWKFVFENIVQNFDDAVVAYGAGDIEKAKQLINNDAKFKNYRNTKLEEAIRRYAQNGKSVDGEIQRKIGEAISGVNNGISKEDFKSKLDGIAHILHDGIANLPKETASIAVVTLPDDAKDEGGADYAPVVKNINEKIASALELYKSGNAAKAMSEVQDIYFDEFEASGMENKIGAIDVNLKTAIEGSFSSIVALMKSGASEANIAQAATNLSAQLDSALEKTGSASSPWSLFIWSLTIILREGLEALIIVAAVVAYLVKTGNSAKMGKVVYSSVGVAIALSFVMAWIMNIIFGQAAGQKRELMEGITMLVAVGLLFYVGFWLLSNAGAKKWSHYIQGHVNEALSTNSATTLWWTVFLAVFREGAETVLFYQAIIFDAKDSAGYTMIAAGFLVGVIALLAIYFIFKFFAIKIPIKPFFLFTSAIIFYMSIVFVGKGIMELVEGKIFVPTTIDGLKFPQWAGNWLGLQPYYETLIPQICMILALVIGIFIMKAKQKSNLNTKEIE